MIIAQALRPPLAALAFLALITIGSAQTPKTNPSGQETNSGKPAPGSPMLVTSHYLHMHFRDSLISLARRVKSGNADKTELTSLAGPKFADLLLATDLGLEPAPSDLKKGAASGGSKPVFKPKIMVPALSSEDYSPQKIEFDKMIPSEVETQSVNITEPFAGTMTASVSGMPSDFKIVQIQSYTGSTQSGNQGPFQVVDQTSTNGSIHLLEDQQLSVIVEVGSLVQGTFQSNLVLTCKGDDRTSAWELSIPMKIVVSNSNKYRAVRVSSTYRPVVFPGTKFNIPMTFKPVNFTVPFKAKVQSLALYGVTAQDVNISFKDANPVSVNVPCSCKADAEPGNIVILATEITADDKEATDSTTAIDIIAYQLLVNLPTVASGFNDDGPFSNWDLSTAWQNAAVVLNASGAYHLMGNIYWNVNGSSTTHDVSGYQYPAQLICFGVYVTDTSGTRYGSYCTLSGTSNWISSHWHDIADGNFKVGNWIDYGGMYKYNNDTGVMFPLPANRVFTLPGGWSWLTVHVW